MPAGDIYEMAVDQQFANQQISNIHHFIQIGVDGLGDGREGLATVWVSEFEPPYLNLISSQVDVLQTRIRRLFPTQTQQSFDSRNVPGNVVGNPLPTNQCSILREYAIPDGRKGVGHVKIPGVDNVFVNEGRVNGSYVGIAEIFGNVFEVDQTVPIQGWVFRACVLGTDDVARQIQRTRMTSRIKQIRSRTVGVGD
jgi:hypothetical protein